MLTIGFFLNNINFIRIRKCPSELAKILFQMNINIQQILLHLLDQGSMNYYPHKPNPALNFFFVNKILLENSHNSFVSHIWLLSHYNCRQNCVVPTETLWAAKLKIFTIQLALCRKCLPNR